MDRSQRRYWENLSPDKTFTTPVQCELLKRFIAADAAILDVGCGYGRALLELRQAGFANLAGVEMSPALLLRAQDALPDARLRSQEPPVIDFPDAAFDAVLLLAVLTCIADDREQLALRDEILRVLRPGGVLYVNDFLLNDDARNLARYRDGAARYGRYGVFTLPEGAVLRHHAPEYVREWLTPFQLRHYVETTYPTMNGHRGRGFYAIAARPMDQSNSAR